jgi:hypothetical protein
MGALPAVTSLTAAVLTLVVACAVCTLQGVVVDSEQQNGGVQLLRVPSAVRELLPSKPYQAPEVNPLPGAETEPDCCSICLVELEAGEQVTVLPCMHFYHKVRCFLSCLCFDFDHEACLCLSM